MQFSPMLPSELFSYWGFTTNPDWKAYNCPSGLFHVKNVPLCSLSPGQTARIWAWLTLSNSFYSLCITPLKS